ncbi:MAG: DUF4861 domain-containing protein [Porphyromonadaceae bacterium]|nr:DUF4861 domain-containing protein [Porphyromonadaceae bacterium]
MLKTKNIFIALFVTMLVASCANKDVKIVVTNPIDLDRQNEMVEVNMDNLVSALQLSDSEQFVVLDAAGKQLPYQITYDGKLIFPATVASNGTSTYTVKAGVPDAVEVVTCGRQYPERIDDIAWENDCSAYRMYGPALQATGERSFGYDVWVKSVKGLVVEARYAGELNPETVEEINRLKETDPAAADELYQSVSYHVDHGNGLDCYSVGPTLGCGATALVVDGQIIYPYCYKTYEILDNGPLRFTVKVVYNPTQVADNEVVETRIISLDAGSHLNKTVVVYDSLSEAIPVVAGVVLHEPLEECRYEANAEEGYILYDDPTDNVDNNNGTIYVGCVFPGDLVEAKPVMYDEVEKTQERSGADGQLLAYTDYQPGSSLTYYWGSGWSKGGIDNPEMWSAYIKNAAAAKRNPLQVAIK